MVVKIRLHPYLKKFTGGREVIEAAGKTVADCVENLYSLYPGLKQNLCDHHGKLLGFYGIYLKSSETFHPLDLSAKVNDGDEIAILALISGG